MEEAQLRSLPSSATYTVWALEQHCALRVFWGWEDSVIALPEGKPQQELQEREQAEPSMSIREQLHAMLIFVSTPDYSIATRDERTNLCYARQFSRPSS